MRTMLFAAALASLPFMAGAQTPAADTKYVSEVGGKELFQAHCATCHGPDAKGGGPTAKSLKHAVPDLTALAKSMAASFPAKRSRRTSWARAAIPRTAPARCRCGVRRLAR